MKKFIAFLVLLCLVGGCVFYFGWIQFAVPLGKYGVMVTKTSGVYPKPIERGVFAWSAERLIPTNAEIYFFDASPFTARETISGELPSANVYAAMLSATLSAQSSVQKPDFSYSATILVSLGVKPESLPSLWDSQGIADQAGLDSFLEQKCKEAARLTCDALLNQKKIDPAFIASLGGLPTFSQVNVQSLVVENERIPDMRLYEMAQESYGGYRAEMNAAISRFAQDQARTVMKNTAVMEQLEKFGEVLEKYPSLRELFAASASPAETLQEIEKLVLPGGGGNAE